MPHPSPSDPLLPRAPRPPVPLGIAVAVMAGFFVGLFAMSLIALLVALFDGGVCR